MAGKSAVLGAALGAAFSAAAVAAPHTQSTPPEEHAARIAGQQGDTLLSPTRFPARVIASEPISALDATLQESPALTNWTQNLFVSTLDDTGDGRGVDNESGAAVFSGDGIKITKMQATMTANRYVASPFTPAAGLDAVDDVKLFAPDYSSVKAMSPLPIRGRSVVGVGLVSLPSSHPKTSDMTTDSGVSQTATLAPNRK